VAGLALNPVFNDPTGKKLKNYLFGGKFSWPEVVKPDLTKGQKFWPKPISNLKKDSDKNFFQAKDESQNVLN